MYHHVKKLMYRTAHRQVAGGRRERRQSPDANRAGAHATDKDGVEQSTQARSSPRRRLDTDPPDRLTLNTTSGIHRSTHGHDSNEPDTH